MDPSFDPAWADPEAYPPSSDDGRDGFVSWDVEMDPRDIL